LAKCRAGRRFRILRYRGAFVMPRSSNRPRLWLVVLLLCLLAAAALGAGGSTAAGQLRHATASSRAGANPVTVSPFPGTPDASARTQISFLGNAGTRVVSVHVEGSRSGHHGGRLEAYSTGTGESFIPERPFSAGERVSVVARVRHGASTTTVRTHFVVATQPVIPQKLFPLYPGDPAQVQHYLSAPALTPTSVRITTPARPGAAPGDFLLAPHAGSGTPGPMIIDQSGNLVWFHPLPADVASTNLQAQRFEGKTVLTWWQGRIIKLGFGQGEDEIYNTAYKPIARVRAGNGYRADLHQFTLTPQGTAWIDAYDPVEWDNSSAGGSKHGVLTDSIVEEIDVKTGLVMWEWHALGHLALTDSYAAMEYGSHPWDYVHLNAVDPRHSGQLLMSSRNTWTVFDVNIHTGALIWRLGGKQSTFKRAPGTVFRFQHDATWQPGGLVSVFDNGYSVDGDTQSRGLLLDPNRSTGTVTLVKQFTNPDQKLLTTSQGDLLNLHDGNWLMGYGGLPNFTEYNDAGRVLFDATLGTNVENYRTYLAPWTGEPATLPAVAAQVGASGSMTVEASWNGATAVSSWRVLAGASQGSLSVVTTVKHTGFQTTCSVTAASLVEVQALAASGHVLATSAAVAPSS
jgi:hypothetical protein